MPRTGIVVLVGSLVLLLHRVGIRAGANDRHLLSLTAPVIDEIYLVFDDGDD